MWITIEIHLKTLLLEFIYFLNNVFVRLTIKLKPPKNETLFFFHLDNQVKIKFILNYRLKNVSTAKIYMAAYAEHKIPNSNQWIYL